jgi:hypothetical protein
MDDWLDDTDDTTGDTHPHSEWHHHQQTIANASVRESTQAAREDGLQHGFNQGFSIGARAGFTVGYLQGLSSGMTTHIVTQHMDLQPYSATMESTLSAFGQCEDSLSELTPEELNVLGNLLGVPLSQRNLQRPSLPANVQAALPPTVLAEGDGISVERSSSQGPSVLASMRTAVQNLADLLPVVPGER